MATWEVTIQVLSLASKLVEATGIRTDASDPENPVVTGYTAKARWVDGDTFGQFKQKLGSAIWSQHEQAVGHATSITALVSDAETAIAAGLDQLEAV